jgi:hypothetical protein
MVDTTVSQQQTILDPKTQAYWEGLMDIAKRRAETPVDIPGYQFATFDPMQTSAFDIAQQGVGSYQPFVQSAAQTYGSGITSLAGGAGSYNPVSAVSYMNPYQQQVTQNAIAEMQRQSQIAQQQLNANAVRSGAFGGSRQGVQAAETARNLADIQSSKILQDYAANFQQAQAAAQADFENQQRRMQQAGISSLQAAQGIANLGGQMQALQQGDISQLYNLGAQRQGLTQAQLDAERSLALQKQYEPFQRIQFASDIYRGAPSGQTTVGQTYGQQPSLASQFTGNALSTYGALSQATKPQVNWWGGGYGAGYS